MGYLYQGISNFDFIFSDHLTGSNNGEGVCLFLSPHPDDLIFSAFSALSHEKGKKICLVFFNISASTRWGRPSKNWLGLPIFVISLIRTLEDKIALSILGAEAIHLNLRDSKVPTAKSRSIKMNKMNLPSTATTIYSPLGVGGHPDHLLVREYAINLYRQLAEKPRIFFYEDLPYAFLDSDTKSKKSQSIKELENELEGDLIPVYGSLDTVIGRKLTLVRMYFTQMNKSSSMKFSEYARQVGRSAGVEFAERYYRVSNSQSGKAMASLAIKSKVANERSG